MTEGRRDGRIARPGEPRAETRRNNPDLDAAETRIDGRPGETEDQD